MYISNVLCQRLGVSVVQITDLLDSTTLNSTNDLIKINPIGPEYGSSLVPLIVSNTRQRYPCRVSIEGEIFAQIPLQRKLVRTVVLDSRNNWKPIEWD